MSKKMNKKITRRSMLKSTTAIAGAAIGSGLITGFPAIHASGTPTIRYLGTAVNMGSEPEKKLFEDTGIKVKYIGNLTDIFMIEVDIQRKRSNFFNHHIENFWC